MREVKYWVALVPVKDITVTHEGTRFWIDKDLVHCVKKELGEATVLASSGLWNSWLNYNYVKGEEKIFADSGGFQFYFLTPGKQKQFYKARDGLYRFQVRVGDYVAGGDIPVGMELDRKQVKWYAELTRDNMEYQFGLDKDLGKRFINVMHGQSPANMEVWYNEVKKFPSQGWAVGAKGSGAFGNLLQLMFLYEKGELTPGKLVHMFAMSGRYTLTAVMWFIDQLGLDLIVSSDSSSYSLGRYGAMFYQGGNIKYDQVRSGEIVLECWNGRKVTDIPQVMYKELYKDLMLTSVAHFCKWFKEVILDPYKRGGKEIEALIKREEVHDFLRWFKEGGTEMVWQKYRQRVPGRSEVRLIDGIEVMENRTKAYQKKVRRKVTGEKQVRLI